jgi:hypothetical protein
MVLGSTRKTPRKRRKKANEADWNTPAPMYFQSIWTAVAERSDDTAFLTPRNVRPVSQHAPRNRERRTLSQKGLRTHPVSCIDT